MILRLIRGAADAAQLGSLRGALDSTLGPGSSTPGGPTRFHLAGRPNEDGHDVLILSFWSSYEAAADGDHKAVSPLSLARTAGLQGLDPAHYEIDETVLRHAEGEPIAIRVATGHFSKPGADIEMQHLLRQRVPLVGDEMTEAYVGRRIVGRSVDVTFVSAWQRLPADRQLDEPFWPDISLRYDRFMVDVYTPFGRAERMA